MHWHDFYISLSLSLPTGKLEVDFAFNIRPYSLLLTGWDFPSKHWLALTSILLIAGAAGVAVPFALRVTAGMSFVAEDKMI